jgi:membrane-associated protease RseP (regulator of RpoE activity)
MLIRKLVLSLAVLPSLAAAQGALVCATSPVTRLGIVSFDCTNCTVRNHDWVNVPYSVTFGAEPVVAETAQPSAFAKGDVIESVDGLAITSTAGSARFASPSEGNHTVTVRRGTGRENLSVAVSGCDRSTMRWNARPGTSGDTTGRGDDGIRRGSGSGRGVGVQALGGDPLIIIDGVVQPPSGGSQIGRFGFAVECGAWCSREQLPNGSYIYRYGANPVVAAVRPGTAADRAGLRVGDEIRTINGKPIVAPDALVGTDTADQLRLTVGRGGKELSLVLTAPR